MITRSSSRSKRGGKSTARKTRPIAERTQPDRSGAARASSPSSPQDQAKANHGGNSGADDREGVARIDEAVATAVQSGYDVLAETIAQGRRAAEGFRAGNYNIRDVPQDVGQLSQNLIQLARQLTNSTLDLCEQLVRQASTSAGPPPPGEVASRLPPFREFGSTRSDSQAEENGRSSKKNAAKPSTLDRTDAIALTVIVKGVGNASSPTTTLKRPHLPTAADDLKITPLSPLDGAGQPLTKYIFGYDLGTGLKVTFTVPKDQPPGTYAGLVFTQNDKTALGMLSIEIGE